MSSLIKRRQVRLIGKASKKDSLEEKPRPEYLSGEDSTRIEDLELRIRDLTERVTELSKKNEMQQKIIDEKEMMQLQSNENFNLFTEQTNKTNTENAEKYIQFVRIISKGKSMIHDLNEELRNLQMQHSLAKMNEFTFKSSLECATNHIENLRSEIKSLREENRGLKRYIRWHNYGEAYYRELYPSRVSVENSMESMIF